MPNIELVYIKILTRIIKILKLNMQTLFEWI